jgi:hypothetical protein
MRVLLLLALLLVPAGSLAQNRDSDRSQLLHMHAELIRAHLEGRVDLWMSLESEDYTSVNGGRISFPTSADREAQRAAYLEGAEFSTYRDLRAPIVRVSDDGSLGWLMAEVEGVGTLPTSDDGRESFHDIWAWVELYEKSDAGWRLVGNASNRR